MISINKVAVALTVVSALAASAAANANTVINFDDLTAGRWGTEIQNGYSGLNWSNFYILNGNSFDSSSGYGTGTVSAPNVAFNGAGNPASFSSATAFNLATIDVTKAWASGITHFDGYVGNILTYSMNVSSTTAGPTLATFNWNGLNKVTMSDGNSTHQTAIDNLTLGNVVAAVPEPETYAMLLAGLGLMGAITRRRQNKQA